MESKYASKHQAKCMDACRPRGPATIARGSRQGRMVLVAALVGAYLSTVNVSFAQVVGACCDQAPFGGCSQTTAEECTCSNCVWSEGQSCSAIECVHTAIPTVSEWGLVVLTLSLVIGGKIFFGRRRRAVGHAPT